MKKKKAKKREKITVEGRICGILHDDALFRIDYEGPAYLAVRYYNKNFPKPPEPDEPELSAEERAKEREEERLRALDRNSPDYDIMRSLRFTAKGEVSFGAPQVQEQTLTGDDGEIKTELLVVRTPARHPASERYHLSNAVIID